MTFLLSVHSKIDLVHLVPVFIMSSVVLGISFILSVQYQFEPYCSEHKRSVNHFGFYPFNLRNIILC